MGEQLYDYDPGDTVRVYVTFYNGPKSDPDRAPVDPANVVLTVRRPRGTKLVITDGFEHEAGSGHYRHAILADRSGLWEGEWKGTGGGVTSEVERFSFLVGSSRVRRP
jgi:hypothetical protein